MSFLIWGGLQNVIKVYRDKVPMFKIPQQDPSLLIDSYSGEWASLTARVGVLVPQDDDIVVQCETSQICDCVVQLFLEIISTSHSGG